jgi:magnesium transporter
MPSLTELLDKPVRDTLGDEIARLQDLVVRLPSEEDTTKRPADVYPPVIGIVARLSGPRGKRDVFIPIEKVKTMGVRGVRLASPAVNLQRFAKREGELVLRGLWDRQVLDVEGRRVVRINDLDLAERNGVWRLVAVDVSPSAAMRRLGGLGLENFGKRIVGMLGREAGANAPLIDWKMVVPVAESGQGEGTMLRLRVPRDRLALMRPADLAYLLEQLTPQQSAELLDALPDEAAADTLEELEDEQQAQILRAMDPERAADVLEEMEPDEAADALQDMPAAEQADLLGRMDREEAADVQDLLGYPEDTAGGIMTTDYISVPGWVTVSEVVAAMRARTRAAARDDEEEPLPQALPEIYVVAEETPPPPRPTVRTNGLKPRGRPGPHAAAAVIETEHGPVNLEAEGRLVGVVSLRDLLLADPSALITSIMRPPACVAHPLENERDAAHLMADHDLVALPVVDDESRMLGIVTVDDAIDVILPTAWKKRIPRRFQ